MVLKTSEDVYKHNLETAQAENRRLHSERAELQAAHDAHKQRADVAEKERDEHKALLLRWEHDLKLMLSKHGKTPAEIRRAELLKQKAELEKQLAE